jgi:hypothetical protein
LLLLLTTLLTMLVGLRRRPARPPLLPGPLGRGNLLLLLTTSLDVLVQRSSPPCAAAAQVA